MYWAHFAKGREQASGTAVASGARALGNWKIRIIRIPACCCLLSITFRLLPNDHGRTPPGIDFAKNQRNRD